MVMDVFPGFGDAGGSRGVIAPQGLQPFRPFPAGLMNGPVKGLHQVWQIAFHFQPSGAVQIAKGQVGVGDQGIQGLGVGQVQGKLPTLPLRFNDIAIPEPEPDRRRTCHAHELGDQPALVGMGRPVSAGVLQWQGQNVGSGFLSVFTGFLGSTLVHGLRSPLIASTSMSFVDALRQWFPSCPGTDGCPFSIENCRILSGGYLTEENYQERSSAATPWSAPARNTGPRGPVFWRGQYVVSKRRSCQTIRGIPRSAPAPVSGSG